MTEEASHLTLEPDPAIAREGGDGGKDQSFGALELGGWKTEARGRRGEKRRDLYPLIDGENTTRPPLEP